MIFVTVGAQMPFDRMVRAVDEWAGRRGRRDVFAQIGPKSWEPRHIEYSQFLEPDAFRAKVEAASLIVAHAGMGSIITALELGKPIIIMPRRGDLKETRNDHQLATAREFQAQRRVVVAFDEGELSARMDELDGVAAGERISSRASGELMESLKGFVERGVLPVRGGTGFDGVICFGDADVRDAAASADELSMMRQFARVMPVLYVKTGAGSGGGAVGPWARATRALKNLSRGIEGVGANLSTITLAELGESQEAGIGARLASQVRAAAKRLGMRAPLIWVSQPSAVDVVERVPHVGLVYHVAATDFASSLPSRMPNRIMKVEADLTVCGSAAEDAAPLFPEGTFALKTGNADVWGENLNGVLHQLSLRGVRVSGSVTTASGGAARHWTSPLSPTNADRPHGPGVPGELQPSDAVLGSFADADSSGQGSARRGAAKVVGAPNFIISPRSIVVLGGMVRPTAFSTAVGRSLFDLPLERNSTILESWQAQASELARASGRDQLEIRVLVDQSSRLPVASPASGVRVQRDALELRGTGGILRDLAAEYQDDDYLLVVGGIQALLRPLIEIVEELSSAGGDVVIGSHADRTPSPIMLCRCRALRLICDRGFVDMKEQALPTIAREHRVRVREGMDLTAMGVKTEAQYVAALRARFRPGSGRPGAANAFAEDWRRRFALVESGAEVDASAIVHDSVVLRGGAVRAGAAVVQSVVCGGGFVAKGAVVTDALVRPAGQSAGRPA